MEADFCIWLEWFLYMVIPSNIIPYLAFKVFAIFKKQFSALWQQLNSQIQMI